MSKLPWYQEGLNFECTGCGGCCTGAPGYVWVTEQEMESIANYLKISLNEFVKKFTREVEGKFSLIELQPRNDCVFLKDKKCSVYEVRPVQCRTFPFWPRLLKSEKEWQNAASYCEGIRKEAAKVSIEEIELKKSQSHKDF